MCDSSPHWPGNAWRLTRRCSAPGPPPAALARGGCCGGAAGAREAEGTRAGRVRSGPRDRRVEPARAAPEGPEQTHRELVSKGPKTNRTVSLETPCSWSRDRGAPLRNAPRSQVASSQNGPHSSTSSGAGCGRGMPGARGAGPALRPRAGSRLFAWPQASLPPPSAPTR